ncbi:MAG TPA: hypothetical protein VGA21_03500 [Cyclobacteriaceae bacterium]|jgi:uncharacterized tellurite resistance protein B-like protein
MKFSELISMFRAGKAGAKSHMKNLIEMAAADGNFDDVEYNLLKQIAKKHKVSEKELKKIKDNPQNVAFEVPSDPKEKFDQLYDLVNMMVIDNYVDREEVNLCLIFAGKFGYKKERIVELVDSIKDNIKNNQDQEATRKRLDWLLN